MELNCKWGQIDWDSYGAFNINPGLSQTRDSWTTPLFTLASLF